MSDFSSIKNDKTEASLLELQINNPFDNAKCFYVEKCDSTMNVAKNLAKDGVPSGTVVLAGEQTNGRGRIDGRVWQSTAGRNLLCTIILKTKPTEGFTLRMGLAVAKTCEAFLREETAIQIKWPNDILIEEKKVCGILCECKDDAIFVGIGCNLAQISFPEEIKEKATSLALHLGNRSPRTEDFLQNLLHNVKEALLTESWNVQVEERLYKKDCEVVFFPGVPEFDKSKSKSSSVVGVIRGLGAFGELVIELPVTTAPAPKLQLFSSGEIVSWHRE